MNRSASLASIESFTSAIDSIEHVELIPIDSSTDAILDEKHDSMIKPESDGKKSNAFKDHKCCLLIATIVIIVFLCIFFIIIYSNRSEVYIFDYNTDNLFLGFEFNCTVIAIVIFICFDPFCLYEFIRENHYFIISHLYCISTIIIIYTKLKFDNAI